MLIRVIFLLSLITQFSQISPNFLFTVAAADTAAAAAAATASGNTSTSPTTLTTQDVYSHLLDCLSSECSITDSLNQTSNAFSECLIQEECYSLHLESGMPMSTYEQLFSKCLNSCKVKSKTDEFTCATTCLHESTSTSTNPKLITSQDTSFDFLTLGIAIGVVATILLLAAVIIRYANIRKKRLAAMNRAKDRINSYNSSLKRSIQQSQQFPTTTTNGFGSPANGLATGAIAGFMTTSGGTAQAAGVTSSIPIFYTTKVAPLGIPCEGEVEKEWAIALNLDQKNNDDLEDVFAADDKTEEGSQNEQQKRTKNNEGITCSKRNSKRTFNNQNGLLKQSQESQSKRKFDRMEEDRTPTNVPLVYCEGIEVADEEEHRDKSTGDTTPAVGIERVGGNERVGTNRNTEGRGGQTVNAAQIGIEKQQFIPRITSIVLGGGEEEEDGENNGTPVIQSPKSLMGTATSFSMRKQNRRQMMMQLKRGAVAGMSRGAFASIDYADDQIASKPMSSRVPSITGIGQEVFMSSASTQRGTIVGAAGAQKFKKISKSRTNSEYYGSKL